MMQNKLFIFASAIAFAAGVPLAHSAPNDAPRQQPSLNGVNAAGVVRGASAFAATPARSHGYTMRRISRHGVYYYVIPRAATPDAAADDFDEEDYEADEFDHVDVDNDGFVSQREARRANPDWARDFKRIDANGDGYLTREEIDAFYRSKLPAAKQ
jgi:hypothetical protein